MSSTVAVTESTSRRTVAPTPPATIIGLTVLVLLAIVGATRLPGVLLGPSEASIRQVVVATSFGDVTVAGHESVADPQSPGRSVVVVRLQVTGADARVPAAAFSLRDATGRVIAPVAGTLPQGRLPLGRDVSTSVAFSVSADGADSTLQIDDGSTVASVPLDASNASARATSGHQH